MTCDYYENTVYQILIRQNKQYCVNWKKKKLKILSELSGDRQTFPKNHLFKE